MKPNPHEFPRITFTSFVLNGEPFIKYFLHSVYPHAHEIIIAEGAVRRAKVNASPKGRSLDRTGEILKEFKEHHDPENKLKILQLDRFWIDKNEMSNACAAASTGDYVWENGIDEFYMDHSFETVRDLLRDAPSIDGMSFRWHNFWGGKNYVTRGWLEYQGGCDANRLFRWGGGFSYAGHSSEPTSIDPEGKRMVDGHWLRASDTMKHGIYCHHYAFVFPLQVFQKQRYYSGGGKLEEAAPRSQQSKEEAPNRWATEVWLGLKNPFRVHNVDHLLSWLERYEGEHPPMALRMFEDIDSGQHRIEERSVDDIETLLRSLKYRIARVFISLTGRICYSKCPGQLRAWSNKVAHWIERRYLS